MRYYMSAMEIYRYMERFRYCAIIVLICLAVSAAASPSDSTAVETLPLPELPATLREPAARANYIIAHFWDAMDFRDTVRSRDKSFMEQNFANYISVFPYADEEARREAVATLLHKAEADSAAYRLLADVAEKYLYEPNSPMLSEDFYILFLEHLVTAPQLGSKTTRLHWQLEAARKNRSGMTAADFSYTTREGVRTTLHQTHSEEQLLLLFYDPECEHCKEVMASLQQNATLNRLVAEKRLTVLAVYSGDDRDLWERDAAALPADWTVGYETGWLQDTGAYVLRAMPTLYLLDRNKRVIQKDVQPHQLFMQ